ncbi:hypothetical protein Tsubulata_049201 [Turnera subulata]|uniref:Uncharacterized protein n=1 Tax=Turnera subulata TaxID=218843 RepID=A0A9Q0FDA9_9ROSI|nr:hypothetical protein Tsubulata_028592 [Turnera subulata]KAJ4841843.1 hypothetical protein Tsubulata_049201 [Turnera subulata]
MGGNRQKKSSSSSFSVFNIFKSRRPRRGDIDNYDDEISSRKVRPYDDDKGPWNAVPDPRINTKASAFIANFHAARISESERQIYQAGKA